jgi:hypothetical protein
MGAWILLIVAGVLLWMMTRRERYVDIPGPGLRPSFDGADAASWRSKIDANSPIGGSDEDYLRALQSFYDTVYLPARPAGSTSSPKDTDVEAFLTSVTIPGLSKDALRQIILAGFSIDRTESAAAREQKQIKFTPTEALEPRDGVDPLVAQNPQGLYVPTDSRLGRVPEGIYAPTAQTEPSREGVWTDRSASWSPVSFASVCDHRDPKCAQNVL